MAAPGFAPGMRKARPSANTRGARVARRQARRRARVSVRVARVHVRDAKLSGAVGHRVVHGGTSTPRRFASTPAVLDTLAASCRCAVAPAAPPAADPGIAERRPGLPQVACFDTAFHRTASRLAQAFALPPSITDRGVHRYGFHGLSYEYIASVLPRHDARAAAGKTVVLHLGNGASMCAMSGGKSVATTMGFTAVDGLPMGTRSGSLDPGVVLYLMRGTAYGRWRHRVSSLYAVGSARRIRCVERHA